MLFSEPYMKSYMLMVVKEGNPLGIYSKIDFRGKNIGVKAGTTAESYINGDIELKDKVNSLKTYKNDEMVFDALENGEIDVLISDEIITRHLMIKHGYKLEILPKMVGGVHEYGIGFRKSDVDLRDAIQMGFDSIVRDGTAKKISEKWFNADLISRGR